MANILYLECYSGISGDMTVAALLDLGADAAVLDKVLSSIPVDGFQTKINRVKKAGLDVCDFTVELDPVHENHDHDMEYLYGGFQKETHGYPQGDSHKHFHGHPHGHRHQHRGLEEILHIIAHSEATDRAKEIAGKIFHILAESEAKAHGVPVEEVHFHEVGAVDSIVDILAVAVCLDNLDIEKVIVPGVYEGRGSVRCQHGIIPVPVPAVVNIVKEYGIPLHMTSTEGELVTPTGAAIVAAVAAVQELPENFTIRKIGLGAGKREYDRPGILRAMLIEEQYGQKRTETENSSQAFCHNSYGMHDTSAVDVIFKLESNIDDSTGEQLGFIMEQLLEAGARDVYYTPIFMKKNRPAYQLNVICTDEMISRLEEIIFKGTTTIGIRRMKLERTILPRESKMVPTRFGDADVKVCTLPNGEKHCYPEYRSTAELAKKHDMGYQEMYFEIQKSYYTCKEEL